MPALSGPPVAPPAVGGATEQLRRRNLSTVLDLVHRDRALSRSALTARTGLNRSTVGDLVSELERLGLVFEELPVGSNLPGRPSPIVRPNPGVVTVALNPEVDAINVGLVSLGGSVLARMRLEIGSPRSAAEVVALGASAIEGLLSGRDGLRVAGVGVAVPGQVRLSDGEVREATHMGWTDEPVAAMVAEATGFPTWAANAANLGMRAESAFGAGRGVDDFIYLIGGPSGIGGGAVTGGELLVGAAGYAGEFGHTFVRSDGTACPCGARGCLEAEVTQAALLAAVGLETGEIAALSDRLRAVRRSDAGDMRANGAAALVDEQLRLLGIAVRTLINSFNPRLVILGGFLGDLFEASGSAGEKLYGEAIRSARDGVTVVRDRLGSDQLMIGAAELVFANVITDPGGQFV